MAVPIEKKPSLGFFFQFAPLFVPTPLKSSNGTTTIKSTKSTPSPMNVDVAPSRFQT